MKLRDALLNGFLSQTFTYRNYISLIENSSLYDEKDLDFHDIMRFSHLSSKYIDEYTNYPFKAHLVENEKRGVKFLTILDSEYPDRLLESYDPPIILSYQGNLDLLKTKCLGIVGGRECPSNSFEIINRLCPELIQDKITVVSGLARGIDAIALSSAINHRGNVIAVIATGLYQYYPVENKQLQQNIAQNHLLISEYVPWIRAKRFHFPERNRIIAGISHGVLVASAKDHSGSLITGNLALQNNREVFALPGEADDPLYEGSNKLIQAGAKLVLKSEDVNCELQYYW
ncbi:DNA-processing protein DprA [Xylocopilactobacillus apis]|uniref:DNA processing protein DprA n=1 Tax=Xylocopilactobacillus apis TaxID=2932183 RepID=A0AAU9D2K1_9LACO|nr:DNA-processing protein DprA [Xylocopilactobacillus apis]BDR56525.1 DNA processing protein DprA [Xylocopilactobacillus apis]